MAAIIVTAALGLIEVEVIRFLVQIRAWKELSLVVLTVAVSVTLGLEMGLTVSIVLSLFFIVRQSTMPTVTVRGRTEGTDEFHDVKVFR